MVSVEYEIDRGGIETTAKDEVFTEGSLLQGARHVVPLHLV
jgi:hypothetical protein